MFGTKSPKCPNPDCKYNFFRVVERRPRASSFKIHFIICDKCATVVGATDYAGREVPKELEAQIKSLKSEISSLKDKIRGSKIL